MSIFDKGGTVFNGIVPIVDNKMGLYGNVVKS